MAGGTDLELDRPRGALQLIGTTVDLYRRFPLLFLILAAAVVVPYDLIVLVATGAGAFEAGHGFAGSMFINLANLALVLPLISALHIHALSEVQEGRRPQLAAVARRGLASLPLVGMVVVVTSLGIATGFVALIVPGVLLGLRWSVAAQVAALQGGGWRVALRRSAGLTEGNYEHVFGFLLMVQLAAFIPGYALMRPLAHTHTSIPAFLAAMAIQIILRSFTALASALLFFELSARFGSPSVDSAPTPASVDPGNYSVEDREPGWYVDPDKPWRMRYWAADGKPGWSKRTTKTPKQTLTEWRDLRWTREKGES